MFRSLELCFIFVFINFVAAASNYCTQQLYAALAQLSVYPPIKSYCSSRYPAASCSTVSTTTTSRPLVGVAPPASVTVLTSTTTLFVYTTTTVTRVQKYCFQLSPDKRAVSTTVGTTPTTQVAVTTTSSASSASIMSSFMLLGGDLISTACVCIAGVKSCSTPTPRIKPRQKVSLTVSTRTSTIYTATSTKFTSVNVCA